MGCRQQGKEKKSAENLKTEKIEASLGFKQHNCLNLEGILSRLTSTKSASSFLDLFQKFSKISFTESVKSSLLSSFSTSEKIQLKNFRVFSILMSNSPDIQKAECLWYIFDEELKDSILNTQIKEMISSLISSALALVPLGVSNLAGEDEKMKTWQDHIKERGESLETKLIKHFTQGKEIVTKEEFMVRVMDRPEGLILNTADIRNQLEKTQVIPNKFANPFKKMKVTKLTG